MSVGRSLYVFTGGMGILSVAAAAMAATRVLRPRDGRRICQESIGGWAGDALLRFVGLEMQVHGAPPWPQGPCFYMANHSSSLDLPILMALRFPDARTFIKERFRWYGPLGVVTTLTGTLFTAPQDDHARRVARFQAAEEVLRRTGCSVFGSPEGTRVPGPEIGPFNRGVFHLVTRLGIPIVPVLILIPEGSDPGKSVSVGGPGVVHVHVGEPLDTSQWREEDVDANKERVRDLFVNWNEELRR
jgi:putative phosphoserine phosphatase/1-acylglycerol-3-phosphate O-acyltransferase